MSYSSFAELKGAVLSAGRPMRCGVVRPRDGHTVEAVNLAEAQGLIIPVGIDEGSAAASMAKAVELVHSGEVEMLMKGLVETADFMKALVKGENGLKSGGIISMLSFREVPNYHKLLAFTDTGICTHPDLGQKREILRNAVGAMRDIGYEDIKVAVLAATETPSLKMPESVQGMELKQMNQSGDITGCTVEGPISLDLALSKEAAEIKGYKSPVAGEADLLLFPDLVSANITTKMIAHITGTPAGVMILGTKIPTVVCSRAASVDTKLLCITLAAARARGQSGGPKNERIDIYG